MMSALEREGCIQRPTKVRLVRRWCKSANKRGRGKNFADFIQVQPLKRAGASRHRQQTTVICVGGVCPRRAAVASASPEQQAEEGNTTAAVAVALSGRSA